MRAELPRPVLAAEEKLREAVGDRRNLPIVAVLTAVLAMDTADKGAISAVAGSLRASFHIGNLQIGVLIAAVSAVGALFTLPAGALVDRISRRNVLIVAIALWTVGMVVSGTATSFLYMLIARLFLGATAAAAGPAVASLIGDFFPPARRTRIYGIVLAGELIGVGIGFFISGEASSFLGWRWALFLMGIPGAAVAYATWRWLPEPERAAQDRRSPDEDSEGRGAGDDQRVRQAVRRRGVRPREDLILNEDPLRKNLLFAVIYVLRIPTYRLLIVASALAYYFFSGVRAFGMIFLTAHFHEPRSVMTALFLLIGAGGVAGVYLGGRAADFLFARGKISARIIVPGVALATAAAAFAPGIWISNIFIGLPLLALGALALGAASPPISAARLDLMHPRLWGRAEAAGMALRGLLEAGAPVIFGALSGALGGGAAGLRWTFLLMLLPLLVAAGLAIPASRSYPQDVATAAASVERTSAKAEPEDQRDPV